VVVQRAERFEPGEHTKRPVEFAAGWLSVEMRADRDRQQFRVYTGAGGEHVANLVDRDRAAERLALRFEPIAHLAVEIRQREAADAALRCRADPRRFHQRVPKPLCVYLQIGHVRSSFHPWGGDPLAVIGLVGQCTYKALAQLRAAILTH
jgi:hypothetical protein